MILRAAAALALALAQGSSLATVIPSPERPPAEAAAPLTLADALALALLGNPELAMFSWEARAAEARVLQAGLIPNPEVDLRLMRVTNPDPDPDEDRHRVIFSEVLELGGKRRRRANLARTEQGLAGHDYEAKRIEIATQLAARFVEVLGAQRRQETLRRSMDSFEETRDRVAALVAMGSLGSVETQRVTRQVGLQRIELKRVESELAAARHGLTALWSNPAPKFTEAVGDLEGIQPVPPLDIVMALAPMMSPAVERARKERSRSHAALALAKAGRIPDLDVGAGIRWDEEIAEPDYLLDLQFSIPIFDRKQGEVRAAHCEIARAEAGWIAAETATTEQVAYAYHQLTEAADRSTTLREEVIPAARATVAALRQAFQRDVTDFDDVLDADRDLSRAEIDYTEALVDYHQALAALEGLVGESLAHPMFSK